LRLLNASTSAVCLIASKMAKNLLDAEEDTDAHLYTV
jgi:hypothetical protein